MKVNKAATIKQLELGFLAMEIICYQEELAIEPELSLSSPWRKSNSILYVLLKGYYAAFAHSATLSFRQGLVGDRPSSLR